MMRNLEGLMVLLAGLGYDARRAQTGGGLAIRASYSGKRVDVSVATGRAGKTVLLKTSLATVRSPFGNEALFEAMLARNRELAPAYFAYDPECGEISLRVSLVCGSQGPAAEQVETGIRLLSKLAVSCATDLLR